MNVDFVLAYRRYGRHNLVKSLEVDFDVTSNIKCKAGSSNRRINNDFIVNEDAILDAIPDGWLPCEPEFCLLMVSDGVWGTGLLHIQKFRSWAKYFDSYSLTIKLTEDIYNQIVGYKSKG